MKGQKMINRVWLLLMVPLVIAFFRLESEEFMVFAQVYTLIAPATLVIGRAAYAYLSGFFGELRE